MSFTHDSKLIIKSKLNFNETAVNHGADVRSHPMFCLAVTFMAQQINSLKPKKRWHSTCEICCNTCAMRWELDNGLKLLWYIFPLIHELLTDRLGRGATFLSYGLTNRSTTRKKPVSIRFLGCKHKRMKVNQENVSPVIGAPHESNRILIHRQIISLAAAVHLWSGVFVCQENKDNLRPHIRCVTVFHQEFTEYNRDLFENQVILSSLQLEIHGEPVLSC